MSSAASSGSSQVTARGSSHGVPTRCWCGENVVTFVSKTSDNPYRRFFRCEVALKRKHEHHLFKWVDEALLEEITMVDSRVMENEKARLEKMEEGMTSAVMERIEKELEKMEERMMSAVMERIEKELCVSHVEMENLRKDITWSIVKRICMIVVAITALAWFYYQMMA